MHGTGASYGAVFAATSRQRSMMSSTEAPQQKAFP